jgi:hypothetical protein
MKTFQALAVIAGLALAALAASAGAQPPPPAGKPAAESALPSGVIVMWSGPLDKIPAGWALCDGREGTPDLRSRFVLGVGAAEYLGDTGGSRSHQHRSRDHVHQIDPPAVRLRPVYGSSGYHGGGARNHYYMLPRQTFDLRPFKSGPMTAPPDSVSHLPPYYKIAFIMKL